MDIDCSRGEREHAAATGAVSATWHVFELAARALHKC
jgi:hypothetical protein